MDYYCPEGWLLDTAKNQRAIASPSTITEAYVKGEILEAVATMCDAQHNLLVNLGCMKGVIPRKEGAIGISDGTTRDIALISRVGKPVCFTVTSIQADANGQLYATLSRRNAQVRCMQEYIRTRRAGDIVNAKVTHLESFGAFCDIGCGIVALLPIDAISVSRISHPRDRFSAGDDIRAVIKQIAPDGRITLTHKELLGTWEENVAQFSQGETVSGIIRSVEEYGVFVELTPNLAGLAEPKTNVYIGQQASVYIKSIIPEKMKVKLIIIDSFDCEYAEPSHYFIEGNHIDRWNYSPESCCKQILSVFSTT